MREIKFRGKRIDNGEWVYGNLVMVTDARNSEQLPFIVISYDYHAYDWIEVIPETVGQFTGLTDRYGNDIYEGDRVIVWNGNKSFISHDGFCFCIGKKQRPIERYEKFEIIGNIHDNPELLEEK